MSETFRLRGTATLTVSGESSNFRSVPLFQLSDASFSERQWACHSLLHLMAEKGNRERLVKGGVVEKVAPLLMDQQLPVREAAASLLRLDTKCFRLQLIWTPEMWSPLYLGHFQYKNNVPHREMRQPSNQDTLIGDGWSPLT